MPGTILVTHNQHQSSTLAAIYDRLMARRGGLWVCWDGQRTVAAQEAARTLSFQQGNEYDRLQFALTRAEYEEGYHGYVHQGLWPVFHQRPDRHVSPAPASGLSPAECGLCPAIAEYAMPDDVIWLQDYHFIPTVKCYVIPA